MIERAEFAQLHEEYQEGTVARHATISMNDSIADIQRQLYEAEQREQEQSRLYRNMNKKLKVFIPKNPETLTHVHLKELKRNEAVWQKINAAPQFRLVEGVCVLCQDDISPTQMEFLTQMGCCKHYLHRKCHARWAASDGSDKCPCCASGEQVTKYPLLYVD